MEIYFCGKNNKLAFTNQNKKCITCFTNQNKTLYYIIYLTIYLRKGSEMFEIKVKSYFGLLSKPFYSKIRPDQLEISSPFTNDLESMKKKFN